MAVERCVLCGEPIGDGNYCPSCGGLRPPPVETVDPLIGTVVADRYEILALVSSGGMGRVYRAVQRMLDRVVAIKIIDPRVMSKNQTAELTSRFMTEARAASRLNHPNVVSVFDFGRTSPAEQAPLFLAMELLTGPSLADVLAQPGPKMPLARVANILRQTLAALGEAHHLGITHRDVKPGNIVLRRQRGDSDHVSVIDFGVARINTERGMTERGRLLGTPHYMAPELITASAAGPSVDLYAAGVILFEMITGQVPFDDTSPMNICVKHASAPRPDPRTLNRNLPDALAEVCFRALAVDVAARYPDAQALAEAISEACSAPMTHKQVSVFPPRAGSGPIAAPTRAARAQATTLPRPPSGGGFPVEERSSARLLANALPAVDSDTPLVGREEPLQWARDLIGKPSNVSAVAFWGKAGTGRSRMLQEVASYARSIGAEVIEHQVEWGPHNEVGYTCLRGLISKLAGLKPDDRRLVGGHASDERLASTGLRELFGSPGTTLAEEPGGMTGAVVAALRWAATKAAKSVDRPLVLVLDNIDLVDGVSRTCLWKFLQGEPLPKVVMLLASEERPPSAPHGGIRDRELLALSRDDAASLVNPLRSARDSSPGRDGSPASGAPQTKASARRVEPLYLEQYRRWRAERPNDRAPTGLREIIEARLQELEPAPRRVLQAVAVGGPITTSQVAALLERTDGVDEATKALESAGFVVVDSDKIRVVNSLYARVALDNAPAGVVDQLHARAALVLASSAVDMERRAYHLLRARPNFEAFMLVEKAVRLRALRGDVEGSIAALSDGYFVSRTCAARGEADANGWHVFGRKLATALRGVGKTDQAKGLLVEVLQTLGPADHARAPVLEELAMIATATGKPGEAERWRREASLLSEPRVAVSRPPRSSSIESRRPPPSRKSGNFPAKESNSRVSVSRVPIDSRAEVEDGGEKPSSKGRKR
ncbi:MAG: protein kinase domain-containing protein [Polyangiaceae bacterium]